MRVMRANPALKPHLLHLTCSPTRALTGNLTHLYRRGSRCRQPGPQGRVQTERRLSAAGLSALAMLLWLMSAPAFSYQQILERNYTVTYLDLPEECRQTRFTKLCTRLGSGLAGEFEREEINRINEQWLEMQPTQVNEDNEDEDDEDKPKVGHDVTSQYNNGL